MYLLAITSVVSLAMVIDRGIALRWRRVIPLAVEREVERCGEEDVLREICHRRPSTASRLLLAILDRRDRPRRESVDALQTRARKEVSRLEKGLVIVEVIVGVAPLLGLVGTIFGLMVLFENFGAVTGMDNAGLARGIAIALNTTLLGLLIAIFSLVAWSYYNRKVESLSIELETLCDSLLQRLHSRPDEGEDR